MSQGWSDEEVKHLRDIRLDPKQNSREKLQALVRHFRTPNASVFAVSGGIGEVSVSRELARKVRDLTKEGKLNWLLNNTQVAAYIAIGEPQVGRWVHNGGEALYATLSVRAVSALERNCWASLEILEPEGRRFPLHWAGLSYTISETQPVYLDIASDVPARLDVAFVFPPPGGTGSNAAPSPGHGRFSGR